MTNKAKLFLAVVLASAFTVVKAQDQLKNLVITDITPHLSVYPCGDRHEAQVILRCQEPFDLDLSSNVDAKLDLTITTEGPEKVYSIVFKTREEGTSFKGRQLTVVSEGFRKYYIPLNLSDKEKLEYMVTDPYSKLRSLFYISTEEGLAYMTVGMYEAAIDKFNVAKQCPEFPDTQNHLDEYISKCDSLIVWRNLAEQYTDREDYFNARALYLKMLNENPSSTIIRDQYVNATENFNRVSRHDIEVAQSYFDTKRYDEARQLYEHVIAQHNPQSSLAGSNLAFIQLKRYKQDNRTRSASFVYNKDCNLGIMFAGLKPDKTGGYLSMSIDKGVIDLAAKNLEPITDNSIPTWPMYQAMISTGWTFRIYTKAEKEYIPKVWMLMSPFSYAIGGYNSQITEYDSKGKSTTTDEYNLIHAWAPEAGVAVRLWRIVLSYRYQYRYLITKQVPVSNNIGAHRQLLSVGICW